MRILRTAILAIGLMSLAAACGGKQKGAEDPAANPCAAGTNPCGNPCAAATEEGNPCAAPAAEENPCAAGEEENPCAE